VNLAWDLPLEAGALRKAGLTFGCGLVGFLGAGACGVAATAGIMAFLARESAGQCGPCVFGLRAVADALDRVAGGDADAGELARIERWTGLIAGRGACHHPDGAAQLMASTLEVLAEDLEQHVRLGRCAMGERPLAAALA
jgi:NADH:ubiquinone oxidoreductase subunit F (NADH-binding)